MSQTPVVLIIYNRPDLTEIVFDSISKAKPNKLLVVADGPRYTEDVEKCKHARAVIDKVDWDCEVMKNYSEVNLGCRKRVSSGLDWVFSEVEEAIILEDDCLPAPSFFSFCQTLLDRYCDDERVMHISGNNFQSGQSRTEYSYYFSKYTHCWGWATWSRAWKHFDVNIIKWPEYKKQGMISTNCEDFHEQKYWTEIFDQIWTGSTDTWWDYQWLYACWSQNGLSILPNSNLVSNIGFRSDATHVSATSPWSQLPITDIWELKHPPSIFRNKVADAYTYDYHYGGKSMRETRNWENFYKHKISSIKNLIKNCLCD